ncbi:MAG: hypothetical protein ACO1OD_12700 [Croceibacterium sp.]
MTEAVSRALMVIVLHCHGASRREWAHAMRAEFDVAAADGKPFAFAAGCLFAAWGGMLKLPEGRHVVATYAIALGLLIPIAAFQFALALGFSSIFAGVGAFSGFLVPGASDNPMLAWSQLGAVPCLLALWLVLGMAHLRLAWVLIERDWARVVSVSAFIGAVLATLFILMTTLLLDVTFVILQAAVMVIEVMALLIAARQQTRLLLNSGSEISAI